MRRTLDAIYNAAGVLAAFFLMGTLVFVTLGIAGRLLDFHLRGTDAYAGYCMAACGFLSLAYTLRRGEHIRVTLILSHLTGNARRALDIACYAAGTLLAGLFAYYAARLAWQSWQFNDISTANDATPLWVPQLGMALGTAVLAIAFVDEFVATILGHERPVVASSEPARVE